MNNILPSHKNPEARIYGLIGHTSDSDDGNVYMKRQSDSLNVGWEELVPPSDTPTPTPTATPTVTPTPTVTSTPAGTPTPTPTPSVSPTQTVTPTNTPSQTVTPTPTRTPPLTPTNTPTPTVTPTNTPTPSPTNAAVVSITNKNYYHIFYHQPAQTFYRLKSNGEAAGVVGYAAEVPIAGEWMTSGNPGDFEVSSSLTIGTQYGSFYYYYPSGWVSMDSGSEWAAFAGATQPGGAFNEGEFGITYTVTIRKKSDLSIVDTADIEMYVHALT